MPKDIKRLGKNAPPGSKVGNKSESTIMDQNLGLKSSPNPKLRKFKPVDNSDNLGGFVNKRNKKFGIKKQ